MSDALKFDLPEALVPFYWRPDVGDSIPLYEGTASVAPSTGALVLEGRLSLDLQPSPSLAFSGGSDSAAEALAWLVDQTSDIQEPAWSFPDLDGSSVPVPPEGAEPDYSSLSFRTHRHVPGSLGTGDGSADRVVFNVVNFLPVLGSPITDESHTRFWRGRVEMAAGDLEVVLDSRHDLDQIERVLRDTRGFALTHVGEIRWSGGLDVAATRDILDVLRHFLSFATGRWVSPVLPVGFEKTSPTWAAWNAPNTSPARTCLSWFDEHNPELLVDLFPQFVDKFSDPFWRDVLEWAIYFYLRANEPMPVEVALTTAQFAFELLAFSVLVTHTKLRSAKQYRSATAAENIRHLLQWCKIPVVVPAGLRDLKAASKSQKWSDGVAATVALRNRIVHPTLKKSKIATDVWVEAWLLSLWQLELVILKLLGYSGSFSSRIPGERHGSGDVYPVPWALP